MNVEFFKTPNPYQRDYSNGLPIVISSSSIRGELARRSKLPFNTLHPVLLDIIKKAIDEAELRTQKQIINERDIHHSVFPAIRDDGSPVTVLELATDKAKVAGETILKLKNHWQENWGEPPTSLSLVDSAWAIDLTPENPDDLNLDAVLIQKPKDEQGIKNIIENLKAGALRDGHLQSVTGICQVEIIDGKLYYNHSLVVVDYGRINPNFNWQELVNLMKNNGHFAGGFSTIDLFRDFKDLVIFEPFAKIQIISSPEFKADKTVPPWDEFSKNQQKFYLSSDATNIEQLIAISIGLVPQA
ncbi:MAG: hypothetical protein Fur009_2540 [Candidatus Microgenomates bacterium]